jgi:O-antigen biosynthesis protein
VSDWNRRPDQWRNQTEADDVVIHLRGLYPYVPREGQLNVLWNISHPDLVTAAECDAFDLIATPSGRRAERLARRTSRPVLLLEQATDPTVFFPQDDPAHERELVLVGNSRGIMRPILRDLLPTGLDLAVWGEQWERFIPASHIAGLHLSNEQVRLAYSSAAIVLNDHWDDMRAEGIVSNRIYDGLACGALVLSDHMPELAERFGDSDAATNLAALEQVGTEASWRGSNTLGGCDPNRWPISPRPR